MICSTLGCNNPVEKPLLFPNGRLSICNWCKQEIKRLNAEHKSHHDAMVARVKESLK